jgi:hypothetical protein
MSRALEKSIPVHYYFDDSQSALVMRHDDSGAAEVSCNVDEIDLIISQAILETHTNFEVFSWAVDRPALQRIRSTVMGLMFGAAMFELYAKGTPFYMNHTTRDHPTYRMSKTEGCVTSANVWMEHPWHELNVAVQEGLDYSGTLIMTRRTVPDSKGSLFVKIPRVSVASAYRHTPFQDGIHLRQPTAVLLPAMMSRHEQVEAGFELGRPSSPSMVPLYSMGMGMFASLMFDHLNLRDKMNDYVVNFVMATAVWGDVANARMWYLRMTRLPTLFRLWVMKQFRHSRTMYDDPWGNGLIDTSNGFGTLTKKVIATLITGLRVQIEHMFFDPESFVFHGEEISTRRVGQVLF